MEPSQRDDVFASSAVVSLASVHTESFIIFFLRFSSVVRDWQLVLCTLMTIVLVQFIDNTNIFGIFMSTGFNVN